MMTTLFLQLYRHRQIETTRLILRPVDLLDAQDMYEYASDEETTRFVFATHQSLSETEELIAKIFLASPLGKYAIVLKESDKMIGTIDVHQIDEKTLSAEIGYTLNKNYWNYGYMTEACRSLLKVGFEEIGFNRLSALHDLDNPASGMVLQKSGLKKNAVIPYARQDHKDPQRLITDVYYQLTKEEYMQNKGHIK